MIFYIKKNKKPVAFLKMTLYNGERRRGVAQVVEHYLREVGAACSNHVTPIYFWNRIVMRFFFLSEAHRSAQRNTSLARGGEDLSLGHLLDAPGYSGMLQDTRRLRLISIFF